MYASSSVSGHRDGAVVLAFYIIQLFGCGSGDGNNQNRVRCPGRCTGCFSTDGTNEEGVMVNEKISRKM